ncbi:hypothetical protein TNIN_250161 [Trichonephila inaurata madagascariensis]|uniref:Uncharacterized protein n=1 Tax=Trichonephila inaurata madagascariensis TaxID=2747483 RepID=A0A8X6Y4K6_9ARAC|nr:hypothetical protein TNIN_250161 [Trichonephila inaurata madagascariensis]
MHASFLIVNIHRDTITARCFWGVHSQQPTSLGKPSLPEIHTSLYLCRDDAPLHQGPPLSLSFTCLPSTNGLEGGSCEWILSHQHHTWLKDENLDLLPEDSLFCNESCG